MNKGTNGNFLQSVYEIKCILTWFMYDVWNDYDNVICSFILNWFTLINYFMYVDTLFVIHTIIFLFKNDVPSFLISCDIVWRISSDFLNRDVNAINQPHGWQWKYNWHCIVIMINLTPLDKQQGHFCSKCNFFFSCCSLWMLFENQILWCKIIYTLAGASEDNFKLYRIYTFRLHVIYTSF